MSDSRAPYLSLVVTARNDDHGGNLLDRMQAFVNGWIGQARRHRIPSELIIVEWNPPPRRPRLAEALRWPEDAGLCEVRIIEVPEERHRAFGSADALPLYQMIAKNVGIRRARGEFVLATNIDILFSSELAGFLAERRLQPGRMYRIDRHDVMSGVPVEAPVDDQLAYCRTHLIRLNAREGTFHVSPDGRPVLSPDDIAPAAGGILFGRGWLPVECYTAREPFRWAGDRAELLLEDPPGEVSALLIELEPGPGTGEAPLDLEIIGDGCRVLAHVTVDRRSRLRLPLAPPLPARLWFRVHAGGEPANRDPRVLNFRVFRLDWDRRKSPGGSAATVQPLRRGTWIGLLWNALQHLINKLARGGRLVTITVPVSPRMRRYLKAYLDWHGFVGMIRHSFSFCRRRWSMRASAPPGSDIFPPDSGLAPGGGWRLLEDYRGESFRRAADGAEVIVSASAPAGGQLGLQVESHEPLDLVLLDPADQPIAHKRVAGLAFVRFSVSRTPGRTQVFRLGLRPTRPVAEPLLLQVFWCGWCGAGASPGRAFPVLAQPWGAGWRWDPAADAMRASGPAELLLRVPQPAGKPLFIDLETDAPLEFKVRDTLGRVLAAFLSAGRAVHRLNLPLASGRMHVVELVASGPCLAYACDWTDPPGAKPPLFPHTNGCGDFTLMARENWFDLRAYPEFDLFSMNLDALFCIAAHYGGVREQMLAGPMRIYHIEHGHGSGWTPEGQAKLFERLAAGGLSFVDNEEVLGWAAQMSRLNAPMIFNHENWGLAGVELNETVVAAGRSESIR